MTTRVTLTPNLPRRTTAYKRFENTNVELNNFYWTFKCALEYMIPNMRTVKSVPELVPGRTGQQLNITSAQFLRESARTERVARHSLLVLSVTAFEDYLKEALTTFLVKNWKQEKTYRISFRPQDLPGTSELQTWLKEKSIETVVDDLLGRSYEGRFEAITRIVIEFGAARPALSQQQQTLAALACEARNCIVHSSAVVDIRAATALAPIIPGIAKGDALDISEAILWQLLGALRDSVRSLDVQLRTLPTSRSRKSHTRSRKLP